MVDSKLSVHLCVCRDLILDSQFSFILALGGQGVIIMKSGEDMYLYSETSDIKDTLEEEDFPRKDNPIWTIVVKYNRTCMCNDYLVNEFLQAFFAITVELPTL